MPELPNQPETADPLNEGDGEALAHLAKNRRLLVILVPKDVPDEFVARLTTWSNFALDTRLMPPLAIPVTKRGDGIVCPYCGVPANKNLELHAPDCLWRTAMTRWAQAQISIERQWGTEQNT